MNQLLHFVYKIKPKQTRHIEQTFALLLRKAKNEMQYRDKWRIFFSINDREWIELKIMKRKMRWETMNIYRESLFDIDTQVLKHMQTNPIKNERFATI